MLKSSLGFDKTLYSSVAKCGKILRVSRYTPCISDQFRIYAYSAQSPRGDFGTYSYIDLCYSAVTKHGASVDEEMHSDQSLLLLSVVHDRRIPKISAVTLFEIFPEFILT